ncbi:hypothetical protein BC831DRAFT_279836 [Entophlyctis helioformis]|nr:hypothetical protein BC831DRAFT_279836 [Entophlyctis helioformis]
MFKKPFSVKSQSRLRSSDVKKLRTEVKDTFGIAVPEELSSASASASASNASPGAGAPQQSPSPPLARPGSSSNGSFNGNGSNAKAKAATASKAAKASTSASNDALNGSSDALAAVLDSLLGDKHAEVLAVKIFAHNEQPGTVFLVNKTPAFFRMLDGPLVPTVYSLWKVHDLLPVFTTPRAVLPKLFNGADLMLPGIYVPMAGFAEFKEGQVMAVCPRGSRIPLVVGTSLTSSAQIASSKYDMSHGKALHTLHTVGDELWAMGDRSDPPPEPPVPVVVSESIEYISSDIGDEDGSDSQLHASVGATTHDSAEDIESLVQSEGWSIVDANDKDSDLEIKSLADSDALGRDGMSSTVSLDAAAAAAAAENGGGDGVDDGVEDDDDASGVPVQVMDGMLEAALMTALITKIKPDPKQLPLAGSSFYTACMLPCRERGTALDIKRSSYKKLSKFYKAMEKRGLLKVKEQGGETRIVSANLSHPLFVDFAPPRLLAGNAKTASGSTINGPSDSQQSLSRGSAGSNGIKLAATELYKPPNAGNVTILVGEISKIRPMGEYMTLADVRSGLGDYIAANNLALKNNARVVGLDLFLANAVLGKDERTINEMRRDEVLDRLIAKMLPFHELTIGDAAPSLRKGPLTPIELVVKKRGGKLVTLILNLEHYTEDIDEFAHQLRIKIATSAAVVGTKERPEIVVQGSKAYETAAHLEMVLGIPIPASLQPVRSHEKVKPCVTRFLVVKA